MEPATSGNDVCVTAAEMTDTLVRTNDRLADAARASGSPTATFFCECGDCLALEMPLSLDEHEEIRAREDLIFVPGHDVPRRRQPPGASADTDWRELLLTRLLRAPLPVPRHIG
jgi:hypothetical protein